MIINNIFKKREINYSKKSLDEFQFLAPSRNAEKVNVYIDTLNKALEHDDVRNIAISGAYGSGKSSFIKTFENKNNKYHFLDISLATFQKNEKDMSLIEKSILQQIFYRVEQGSIPQSRFKRINTVSLLTLKAIYTILFILSFLIFFNSEYVNFLYYPNDLKFIPLLILIIGFFIFFKSIIQNFTGVSLEKLNLQNLEIETNKEDEGSLLNKYLDEILYFFSQTKYNVIVFQDLDRFGSVEIFTKLRELNNFLNNSEQVKKEHDKIVFLYAIKDDMFKSNDMFENGDTRTKFFDFIIPIIPYINSSTSYDKLLDFFEKDLSDREKFNEKEKNDFEEFLRDIALYIKDMRLLKNIYNEYIIYNEKIGNNLDKTKLLAMMVYKNFYPEDFDFLHKDKGKVFESFKNKNKYIKDTDEKYSQDIKEFHSQIKQIENEQHKDINELRMVYIYKIIQKLGSNMSSSLVCDNRAVPLYEAILDNNFKCIQNANIIRGNTPRINTSFNEIEKEMNSISYKEREKLLANKGNNTIEVLESELKQLKEKQKLLNKQSFKQLCNSQEAKEIIAKDFKENDFLQFLIFNGHIDENYYMFLSYAFNKSLTPSDTEFLKSIINNNGLSYDYKLINLQELVNKLKISEFQKKSILNYDLINFLIENKKTYKQEHEIIFEQLSNNSKESIDFIFKYIDFLPQTNEFLGEISYYWKDFWIYIYENSGFTSEEKENYFYLLLYNVPVSILMQFNKKMYFKIYINKLTKLKDLTVEDNQKFQDLIKSFRVKFNNLSEPISNILLFNYIYENDYYVLNRLIIEQIIYTKYEKKNDIEKELYSKHLTTIKVLNKDKKLLEYIKENISQYIDNIFLEIESNKSESEEIIIWLLNNDNLSNEQKMKIIDSQDIIIEDISKVESDELLNVLFEKNKVKATWGNISLFYNLTKTLTKPLIGYLSIKENADSLSKVRINSGYCDKHKDFDKKVLQDILVCNDIDSLSYNVLIKSNGYWYKDLNFCELSEGKIDMLLNEGKVQLTSQNIERLIECSISKQISLIENLFDTFIENYDKFSKLLRDKDFEMLFASNNLTSNQKFILLDNIDFTLVTVEEQLAISLSKLYLNSKKIMIKELLNNIVNKLPYDNKLDILVHQLVFSVDQYDCNEIKNLLEYLGEPYDQVCKRQGSYKIIPKDDVNKKLAEILKSKGCISTFNIKKTTIRINRFGN